MYHSEIDKSDYTRDARNDATPAHTPPPAAPPHMPYSHSPAPKIKRPSRFVLFLLAFLPGLGHMYMGLIKRGLFYLSAVAFAIFATVQLGMTAPIFTILTAFAILGIYAVSFFESFVIRRNIAAGVAMDDNIPEFAKSKTFLVALAATLSFLMLLSILEAIRPILGIVVFVAILVFVFSKKSKKS